MSEQRPTLVQVPSKESDRPSWGRVGVIAFVGFVAGVAWPRLAGIRPGPSAPGESTPKAAATEVAPAAASSATPQPPATAAAFGATPPAASDGARRAALAESSLPAVLVSRGNVLSCKSEDGKEEKGGAECGGLPGLDALLQPRLKYLAHCPAASGASGKLSVVFRADFAHSRLSFDAGRSSTVENRDSLSECLRTGLEKVSLGAVDHEAPLYTVYYGVTFTPRDSANTPLPFASAASTSSSTSPGSTSTSAGTSRGTAPPAAMVGALPAAPAPPTPSSAPAAVTPRPVPSTASSSDSGTAEVAWEVAIVRDAPRTGSVVARLQRGAKVRVGVGEGGWYRVQYGTTFGNEGWVYRGAIAR